MRMYMVTHKAPGLSWEVVERNWRKLADIEHAKWIKTYFNVGEGIRYCIWLAPNKKELEKVFADLDIGWELILEVEETSPDLWGSKWEEHVKAEATADTLGF